MTRESLGDDFNIETIPSSERKEEEELTCKGKEDALSHKALLRQFKRNG